MKPFRKDISFVLDAADAINRISSPRKAYDYKREEFKMTSNSSNTNTYIIPDEELAGYAKGLLTFLSSAAVKLAIQIGDELKFNNALWYFDPKGNRSLVNALRELKEKKVLFQLAPKYYYVNPLCIRKGNAVSVANRTRDVILEERGACPEAIKPLPGKILNHLAPYDYDGVKLDLTVDFGKKKEVE